MKVLFWNTVYSPIIYLRSLIAVMWSETVGLTLRTRPVWDQKTVLVLVLHAVVLVLNWYWSCRSRVVLWNTVLLRSSS